MKLNVLLTSLLLTGSAVAFGKSCPISIDGNDQMQFSTKELHVAADCTEVALTIKHVGKLPKNVMGHNWVLTKAADMDAVVSAGIAAGLANEHLPKNDARVIAATKLVGGGESASVTFPVAKLKAGESYKFFCTFPGHAALMNGVLTLDTPAGKKS